MRKFGLLFLIVGILVIALYTLYSSFKPHPFLATKAPTSTLTNQASFTNMQKTVKYLSLLTPPRNFHNPSSLNKAADYIEQSFKENCPQVKRQTFTVQGEDFHNIICLFGEEKDLIIVGAHYDVDGDSIGADDNASGVAGLLELAHLLKMNKTTAHIELVAYTLEELPNFRTHNMGSYHHAEYLSQNKVTVKYMLSLEMIGYFSDDDNSQKIPSRLLKFFYPSKGNFIAIIGRYNKDSFINQLDTSFKLNTNIPIQTLHAPEQFLSANSSDQLNYWQFNFPAAMITDTGPYRNPHYHKLSDTLDTVNYEKAAKVIDGVYTFIAY
jgi:Zn-dependent M28 family amino/carboxypeptidase